MPSASSRQGNTGVGQEPAAAVARDRNARALLPADADDRAERCTLVHFKAGAELVLHLARLGQRNVEQGAQSGGKAFALPQDVRDAVAVQLDDQPPLRVAHRAHAVDPSERRRIAADLLFHHRLRGHVLRHLRAELAEDVGDAGILPREQAAVFLLLPPQALPLTQREECAVDGADELGQMHAARGEMIGKILHFRAAAREHGLRDIVQRRERGHVVLLPALCAQHAALAHPVARPVEYDAQVFVSCCTTSPAPLSMAR